MIQTLHILEQAADGEAQHLLKLISELEGDALYAFIGHLAHLQRSATPTAHDDILGVAQNIKGIMDTIENFYST